jgi:hypothetical protein
MLALLQVNPEMMQSKPKMHPSLRQLVEERANNNSKLINNKLKMKLRLVTQTLRNLVARLLEQRDNVLPDQASSPE